MLEVTKVHLICGTTLNGLCSDDKLDQVLLYIVVWQINHREARWAEKKPNTGTDQDASR